MFAHIIDLKRSRDLPALVQTWILSRLTDIIEPCLRSAVSPRPGLLGIIREHSVNGGEYDGQPY